MFHEKIFAFRTNKLYWFWTKLNTTIVDARSTITKFAASFRNISQKAIRNKGNSICIGFQQMDFSSNHSLSSIFIEHIAGKLLLAFLISTFISNSLAIAEISLLTWSNTLRHSCVVLKQHMFEMHSNRRRHLSVFKQCLAFICLFVAVVGCF